MSIIVLNPRQSRIAQNAGGPIEIRDHGGKTLGRIGGAGGIDRPHNPAGPTDDWVARWMEWYAIDDLPQTD